MVRGGSPARARIRYASSKQFRARKAGRSGKVAARQEPGQGAPSRRPRPGHRPAITRRQEPRWSFKKRPDGRRTERRPRLQTAELRRKFTEPQKPANLAPMFREALQGVVEGTEGGIAGLLMD